MKLFTKADKPQETATDKAYKKARALFLIDEGVLAAVLVNLCAGSYLAGYFSLLGASDALLGVLLSIAPFAALLQFFTPLLSERLKRRKACTVLCFSLSYLCKVVMLLLPVGFGTAPAVLGAACILYVTSSLLNNFAVPMHAIWITGLLPMSIRGKYFGKKDSVTYLVSAFASYAVGALLDLYEVNNALRYGFFFLGIVGVLFWIAEVVCHGCIFEPKTESADVHLTVGSLLRQTFGNKLFYKLLETTVLYDIAIYLSNAYLSIYVVTKLHLSYGIISIMALISILVKAVAAPIWGKYATKTSFFNAARKAMWIEAGAFILWGFAVKENIGILYPIAILVLSVGQAGGLAVYGLKFDMAPKKDAMLFISVGNAVSGILSFLIALAAAGFVGVSADLEINLGFIRLCNMQILFFLSAIFSLLFCLYMRKLIQNPPQLDS